MGDAACFDLGHCRSLKEWLSRKIEPNHRFFDEDLNHSFYCYVQELRRDKTHDK